VADYVTFREGMGYLGGSGLPASTYLMLSNKSVDGTAAFTKNDTLVSAANGEINTITTATGYKRGTCAEPTPSGGTFTFPQKTFATDVNTDWPSGVRSCVLCTTPSGDNSGVLICAWNLQTGGGARDMSAANTTEQITPTFVITN
jgi:hypothetical protein